ncbi:MAG TPA: ATP-binding protein [Rhodanobacteraceae bacterium]|nr:ATP-binding protein [Rhodanobacteraceae bacterium]
MPVSTLPDSEADVADRDAATLPERDFNATFGEMTHAVLNALNAVAAAAELSRLLLRREESAEASKSLARVEPECLRAARLLREGRAFLTFRLAARSEVDIAALLDECAERFAGRAEIVGGAALPALRGDAEALRKLFTELLENAFVFGATRVRVTPKATGSHAVRIDFLDDGPGIAVPAARAFAPFFSSQPNEHSGLGLPLARRIAEAHGGRIGIGESESGALIWIELPLPEA